MRRSPPERGSRTPCCDTISHDRSIAWAGRRRPCSLGVQLATPPDGCSLDSRSVARLPGRCRFSLGGRSLSRVCVERSGGTRRPQAVVPLTVGFRGDRIARRGEDGPSGSGGTRDHVHNNTAASQTRATATSATADRTARDVPEAAMVSGSRAARAAASHSGSPVARAEAGPRAPGRWSSRGTGGPARMPLRRQPSSGRSGWGILSFHPAAPLSHRHWRSVRSAASGS